MQSGQVARAHSTGSGGAYDDHGITDLSEMLNHTGYFNYIAQREPNDSGRMMSQGDNIVLINEAAPNQIPTASFAYFTLVNPHSFEGGSLSSFDFVDMLISPSGVSYHDNSLEQYLSGFTVNPFIHGFSGVVDILWTRNGMIVHKNHASWNFEKKPCEPCGAAGCRLSAELNSIHLKIPLGDFAFGKESSELTFDSEVLANPGPSALKFVGRTGADASTVNRASGVITSVMTGNSIASVTAAPSAGDANRFEIQFTYIDDPRTDPVDAVYRKVSVEKIGEVVWVTELGNGASRTYAYANPAAGIWTMEESGLRQTSKEEIHSDDPKARITRRRTEEKGADDQWKTIALEEIHEHKFHWGWELVRSILDPDGTSLETRHDYYDYDEAASSNPSLASMGKLKQEVFPSGLIRQYEYFSNDPYLPGYSQVDVIKEAFGASLAKETRIHKKYLAGTFTSLEEVWVAGFIISKKEVIGTAGSRIEKVYPSAAGQPLVTTSTDSNGAMETTYPDGSVRKVISSVSSGLLTETVFEGMKNPNTGHFLLNGTESIRVLTPSGDVQRTVLYRIHSGVSYRVEERITVAKDPMGRPERVNVFAGNKQSPVYLESFSYSCCGLAQETGRDGIASYHYYDGLGRRWKTHRNGISEEKTWDGLVTHFHRFAEGLPSAVPGALPENEVSETVRDLTGVEVLHLDRSPKDGSLISSATQTIHCPEPGIGKRVVYVGPATSDDQGVAATLIEEYFPDGRLRERRGSLVAGQRMAYAVNATGVMETSSIISSTGASFESRTTQKDWAGRDIAITFAGDKNGDGHPDSAIFFYDGTGRVIKAVDPDSVTRMYSHSVGTGVEIAAIDRNGNGLIDFTVDEISIHREGVGLNASGDVVQWTEEACRSSDAQGASAEVRRSRGETTVDGLNAESFVYGGAETAASKWARREIAPGQWEITNTTADGTSTIERFDGGLLVGQTGLSSDGTQLFQRSYSYDLMQRPVQITDSRGPATTCQYVSPYVDLVSMVNVGGRVSIFSYDERGRTILNDEPDSLDNDGAVVSNARITHYWPDGNVREQLGSPGYRTSYTYDAAHRVETLTTYGSHPSMTRWEYDSDRGWLVAKRYKSPSPGQGNGESFAYTGGGRLKTKSLARGVDIHYSYDPAGNQVGIDYSDGTHPVIFSEIDQRGRPHRIIDASGGRNLGYDGWGELASEAYQSGVFSSAWSASRTRDFIGRLASLRVFQGGSGLPLHEISYGYDAAGRVTSVASGGKSASYHYDSLHQNVSQIGLAENSIPVLVATLQYDNLLRLQRISYHNGKTSGPFKLHSDDRVHRDGFGNIEKVDSKDGTHQIYRYNAAGELASARCQAEGAAVLAGQSFDWAYDGVGNRLGSGRGGDEQGHGLRETSYLADPSHQYATILNPGAADVIGLAAQSEAVTVFGETALQQGNFFHHEVSASN
ncbi:MAG: RHS repeat protein, partial [Armatimonadetes bacterium]|nr:RHS repeat protein [Akkermansiaceae bacterium]